MVQDPAQFYEAGCSFGEFQAWLSDFSAETLHEIVPHFHDTPVRYSDLRAEVEEKIRFLLDRESECCVLMRMMKGPF